MSSREGRKESHMLQFKRFRSVRQCGCWSEGVYNSAFLHSLYDLVFGGFELEVDPWELTHYPRDNKFTDVEGNFLVPGLG